ncbi:AI-2E family transporter [Trueperella sp. LYQ143]|uniref:AI-2E family transporter n=1 Tax=Trueperella sp. LYQ143 TaxID=3391059 RepID=UPI003983021B
MSISESTSAAESSDVVIEEVVVEPKDNDTNGIIILAVLALMTVAGLGLHFIAPVFTPIFLSFTLVLAVRPVGRGLIRRGVPSWIASSCVIIVLIIVVFGLLGITVLLLTPVPQTLMNYSENFEVITKQLMDWLEKHGSKTIDLQSFLEQLNFNSLISMALDLVDKLTSFGGLIMIVIVAAFFIAIDTTVTARRSLLVNERHSNIGRAMKEFERRVRSYWLVSTFFGLIVAVVDGAVLQIMGIPLAWTWAYWAFITNYIPNVGFIVGVTPPMAMALLDQGWQSMVWVLVLYSVINVVIQTFIQPKFTGDAVGLSPTVTFVSLAVWTSIVGLLGSILAVPLTLFFKALLVDSDPKARWLDAYLVSEADITKRLDRGMYAPEDEDEEEEQPRPRNRKLRMRGRKLRLKR